MLFWINVNLEIPLLWYTPTSPMSAEVHVMFKSENGGKNDLLPTKLATRWLIYTRTRTKCQ